ncbi:MAG TPA: hypothetical protein VLH79_07600, partial [Chthonomonadales bacterium]|nr:hypothetical protein [Chthonomonadales bacterium]HSV73608.1 hypothetical protein [Chthonomonadales bacterium]
FNGLFIVGVAATIHPIPVDLTSLAAGLGFGALLVAMIYPPRSGMLLRSRGALLLAVYVAYLAVILQQSP